MLQSVALLTLMLRCLAVGGLLLGVLQAAPLPAPTLHSLSGAVRDVWTTREGLPHNTVNALAQGPDGYLWIATWEGLVRYDGREFHAVDRRHVPDWPDDGVRAVHVGADGTVWAGTARGGLVRYRDSQWEVLPPARGLVTDLLQDAAGRLWVATEAHGLERLDADGRRWHFDVANGLPANAVFGLALDREQRLYAATAAGLARVSGERIDTLGDEAGLPQVGFFAIEPEPDGRLLAGGEAGAFLFDPERGRAEALALPAPVAVSQVLALAGGERFLGSVNHGLLRHWQGDWEQLGSDDGLPNQRILALLRDREDNLWIGSNRGLVRLRDAPLRTYGRRDGLRDEFVRSVLATADGALWVGSSRGLDRIQDGRLDTPTPAAALGDTSILSLAEAADGRLWVGTFADGLLRLGPQGIEQRLQREQGLPSNEVRSLMTDRRGGLWVGTALGLAQMGADGVVTQTFGLAEGLPGQFISALAQSPDGAVWVGTATGLARIVDSQVEAIDLHAQGEAEFVFGLRLDPGGSLLWLATDRGLLRHDLQSGGWRTLGLAAGLPVEKVFQLVIDRAGAFWLSSNRGLIRIAPGSVEAVLAGRQGRLDAVLLGTSDGMASSQCNGGSSPAATLAADGSVWVATALGVVSAPPSALRDDRITPPQVVIETLEVDGQRLPPKGTAILAAGTRRIALRFVGPSFLTPEWIRYRTRLDGFDDDWVERGPLRVAEYTNLPPGRYRFEVQAAHPDSPWSPQAAGLDFEIAARLWERRDFWLVVGALALALAVLLPRWRFRQLREREHRLRQRVEERTRDLRQQTERLLVVDAERNALVEQLRLQAEAFERQSREDGLTGLLNRRGFDEALQAAAEQTRHDGRPLCLALFDLDHFKAINDRHSHTTGDRVLGAVADLLRATLAPPACLARWGGEEFAVFWPDRDLARAQADSERLRRALAGFDSSAIAPGLQLSLSGGVAQRHPGESLSSLLQRADAALYRAKAAGRNIIEAATSSRDGG